jgi:hypothetical protein
MAHSTTAAVESELLKLSSDCANLTDEEVLNNVLSPEWDKAGRMYGWRNHVKRDIKRLWPSLALESKLLVFFVACEEAYDEDGWDSLWSG